MATILDQMRFAKLVCAALVSVVALCAVSLGAVAQAKKSSVRDARVPALQKRVQQLEEQIVDMQVVIGTLESLNRTPGQASAAGGGYSGGQNYGGAAPSLDSARLQSMETQIRALTAQVEQLSRNGNVARGGGTGAPSYQGYTYNNSTQLDGGDPNAAPIGGFGSTTVTPGNSLSTDQLGGLIADLPADSEQGGERTTPRGAPSRQSAVAPGTVPGTEPARDTIRGNPKALYETAYGYLLQQDYGAAEVAFADFLRRFPEDKLAGNAQYWLGESHYVRGKYRSAAGAFLRGYQTYAKSAKASDSLLKLAMSLDRMGQKDAACSSFDELNNRFPKAPNHVKNRASTERRRIGC